MVRVPEHTPEHRFYSFLKEFVSRGHGDNSFLFSMSEDGDLLSQWRAYCASGGVSIGFKSAQLAVTADQLALELEPCIYDYQVKDELIKALVEESFADYTRHCAGEIADPEGHVYELYQRLRPVSRTLKHDGFKEEREWRLIVDNESRALCEGWRVRGNLLVGYRVIPWTFTGKVSINVGPHPYQQLLVNAIGEFLRSKGLGSSIGLSQIPYRSL